MAIRIGKFIESFERDKNKPNVVPVFDGAISFIRHERMVVLVAGPHTVYSLQFVIEKIEQCRARLGFSTAKRTREDDVSGSTYSIGRS